MSTAARGSAGPLVTRYAPVIPAWPVGQGLRIVALADFHICAPWMNVRRLQAICDQARALDPDIIVLLGDFLDGPKFSRPLAVADWARSLQTLSAPLGVHAILGNHDYDGTSRQGADAAALEVEQALVGAGIAVYINRAVRIAQGGRGFWLAGLGDQYAFQPSGRRLALGHGLDDLAGTLAQVTSDEPILLLAHEPDIFPEVPARVALTLSGHTHGGQIRLLGYAPVVPSRFRQRYLYGHIVEAGRHLIVSAGLGFSGWPIRVGAPAEIVLIELGGAR